MRFLIFDYVSAAGINEFNRWATQLEVAQKAKLKEKIDKLRQHGDDLHPHMLSGTDTPGILKLRVHGNVQLRPLLCKGPVFIQDEYTMLMGAIEVGGKWVPRDAPAVAKARRDEVLLTPKTRRTRHEKFY